jgi:hypothetical protein
MKLTLTNFFYALISAEKTKNSHAETFRIRDLRTGIKQVNLKAKVLEIVRPTL